LPVINAGGALLAWGFQQQPNGFRENMSFLMVMSRDNHDGGHILMLLWVEKVVWNVGRFGARFALTS